MRVLSQWGLVRIHENQTAWGELESRAVLEEQSYREMGATIRDVVWERLDHSVAMYEHRPNTAKTCH